MKAGCGEVKQSVLVFSPQIFSPCQIDVSKRQRVSHRGPHDPVHQPHREPDAERRRWRRRRRRRRKGGWRMEDQSKWSSFSLKVREGKRKVVGLNPQGGNHSRRSKWVLKGAVRNVRTWVALDDLWEKLINTNQKFGFCDQIWAAVMWWAISPDGMFAESIHVRLIWFVTVYSWNYLQWWNFFWVMLVLNCLIRHTEYRSATWFLSRTPNTIKNPCLINGFAFCCYIQLKALVREKSLIYNWNWSFHAALEGSSFSNIFPSVLEQSLPGVCVSRLA